MNRDKVILSDLTIMYFGMRILGFNWIMLIIHSFFLVTNNVNFL